MPLSGVVSCLAKHTASSDGNACHFLKTERCGSNRGAYASGVWFAASRRKLRPAIITHQTLRRIWSHEAAGATLAAARGTRTLPKTNCMDPVKAVYVGGLSSKRRLRLAAAARSLHLHQPHVIQAETVTPQRLLALPVKGFCGYMLAKSEWRVGVASSTRLGGSDINQEAVKCATLRINGKNRENLHGDACSSLGPRTKSSRRRTICG